MLADDPCNERTTLVEGRADHSETRHRIPVHERRVALLQRDRLHQATPHQRPDPMAAAVVRDQPLQRRGDRAVLQRVRLRQHLAVVPVERQLVLEEEEEVARPAWEVHVQHREIDVSEQVTQLRRVAVEVVEHLRFFGGDDEPLALALAPSLAALVRQHRDHAVHGRRELHDRRVRLQQRRCGGSRHGLAVQRHPHVFQHLACRRHRHSLHGHVVAAVAMPSLRFSTGPPTAGCRALDPDRP